MEFSEVGQSGPSRHEPNLSGCGVSESQESWKACVSVWNTENLSAISLFVTWVDSCGVKSRQPELLNRFELGSLLVYLEALSLSAIDPLLVLVPTFSFWPPGVSG